MRIKLVEIESPISFGSTELRKRALESSKTNRTRHYRVLLDETEAAFASLDRWPERGHMVLYEIFVLESMRRQGIASAILVEVEKIAVQEGFQKIHLHASPLDRAMLQEELVDWYIHRGYELDPIIADHMEKRLIST